MMQNFSLMGTNGLIIDLNGKFEKSIVGMH